MLEEMFQQAGRYGASEIRLLVAAPARYEIPDHFRLFTQIPANLNNALPSLIPLIFWCWRARKDRIREIYGFVNSHASLPNDGAQTRPEPIGRGTSPGAPCWGSIRQDKRISTKAARFISNPNRDKVTPAKSMTSTERAQSVLPHQRTPQRLLRKAMAARQVEAPQTPKSSKKSGFPCVAKAG